MSDRFYVVREKPFTFNPDQGRPKPYWLFLAREWQEIFLGQSPISYGASVLWDRWVQLWVNRKSESLLFSDEASAVAALLVLDDLVPKSETLRVVTEHQQP